MIYIFDLDGTLVKTIDLHAETFIQAFKEEGREVTPQQVKALIGFSAKDIIKKLGANNPKRVLARKTELFVGKSGSIREVEGATRVIGELKARGHKVCIATSSSMAMTQVMTRKFKWPVDMVVTADDVERGKPAPDMLLKILKALKGPAVFIGDARYDRQAAAAAGIPVLILGEDIKSLEEILEMDL